MEELELLVLGGPAAGKTHYAGQLLGRLRHDRRGCLRLKPGGVRDLTKLEEVLSCLEDGRAAGHTPAGTWTGICCDLETTDGANATLKWPEYAGERLFSIVEQRILPHEWRTSVQQASGWMLFVRPSTLRAYEDLLERPTGMPPEHTRSGSSSVDVTGWDDRARYVELLQMLVFAAGRSTFDALAVPRLAVVLSCWDELENPGTPEQIFSSRLPLVEAFVRSTWKNSVWSVWGLSSLGRQLSQSERDPEFLQEGPENFGYVVPPGSTEKNSDLTAPVAWLLGT